LFCDFKDILQHFEFECLVLLCDQNSFGRSKMVLVWPNWFGLAHNNLVTTKMKWSWPKWIAKVQIVIFYQNESQFGPDQFILVVTISFYIVTKSLLSSPNQFGRTKTILDQPKPFWINQNCFGHIEGQGRKFDSWFH
jgi:hypothetical protein